jgi:hypothetical protein
MISGQPGAKVFVRPHLNRRNVGVLYACCPREGGKLKKGGSQSKLLWTKVTRAKRTGVMA